MWSPRGRSSLAGAALLFGVLTLVFTWPLSIHPATTVVSEGPDTNQYIWTLGWDAHAFLHQPLSIFEANIFYPERHTLAYSENLIGSAFFAAPIIWATGNPVLGMNTVVLLSCVLCGLGAYVLARTLGCSGPAAMLAGLVFAFSPPRFLRLDQLHLTTVQWIPFALAYLHKYFDHRRRGDLWMFAVFVALQGLTSGHGTVFVLLASFLIVAIRLALDGPSAINWCARDLSIGAALVLVPLSVVALPYSVVQEEMGLRRTLEHWSVSASSFIASPSYVDAWLLKHAGLGGVNDAADAFLFPGILPLILVAAAIATNTRGRGMLAWLALKLELLSLATCAFAVYVTTQGGLIVRVATYTLMTVRQPWRAWAVCAAVVAARLAIVRIVPIDPRPRLARWREAHRRDATVVYAVILGVCLWLAVGSPVGLWPYVYWLPGLNFIRVPSRFLLLGLLAVASLTGLGFDRLFAKPGPRRAAIAAMLGALMLAEFAVGPLETTAQSVQPPAIDRWLATEPGQFAIAEVPLVKPALVGPAERRLSGYMLHSMAHWHPTVAGYSGFRPPLHERLYGELTAFPDDTSIRSLSAIGVRFIVMHTDEYGPGELADVDRRMAAFSSRLRLVRSDGSGRIYSLVP